MARRERSIKEIREEADNLQSNKKLSLTKDECNSLFLSMDQLAYVSEEGKQLAFLVKTEATFKDLLGLASKCNVLIGHAMKALSKLK